MKPNNKDNQSPKPDFEPIPGSVPKRFPNQPEPLSSQAEESSSGEEAEISAQAGPGEDPLIESGIPKNDPEQPRETDEEKSME